MYFWSPEDSFLGTRHLLVTVVISLCAGDPYGKELKTLFLVQHMTSNVKTWPAS